MKSKSIELLAFDRQQNLQYEGKCKISINRLSSMLLVEPKNEEYKMVSAMFEWDFAMEKNILFVCGEHELCDFALVFDEEVRCKKVYDFISKENVQNGIEKEKVYTRFLTPICKRIAMKEDNENSKLLKKIIAEWIDKHQDGEGKEELIKLLKENNIFEIVYSFEYNADLAADNKEAAVESHNRKRRHSEMNDAEYTELLPINRQKRYKHFSKTIDPTFFKYVNVKSNGKTKRKLLIFINEEKTHCYEYLWSHYRNLYFCSGCKNVGNDITAISKNGLEYVKIEDKKHVCTPMPYIPQNYNETKFYQKPNYEILENCSETLNAKILILFDGNERKKCWDFRAESKQFYCRRCNTPAKLWNENTKNEYIELMNAKHKCNLIPYEPQKYFQFNNYVLAPDFEFQNVFYNGKERKQIIIFDKADRNLCYLYSHKANLFLCRSCATKKHQVSAKILKNNDNEDYILLSAAKHICKPRAYATVKNKDEHIILRQPNFKVIENSENERKKLIIFDSKNPNFCYEYFQHHYSNTVYYCIGCKVFADRKRKNGQTFNGKVVSVQLCKDDENGENIVRINNSKKHICKIRKYEPKKFEKVEPKKCYNYFFFRRKTFPKAINVAITHPENPKLCFELNYHTTRNYFRCIKCKGTKFSSRIEKNENGKEFLDHDYKKHDCKPINISSISAPKFIILKRNELNLGKEMKSDEAEVDESRILEEPNFELRPNKNGILDASLFIFHSKEDRNLGYKYYKSKTYYVCSKKNSSEIHCNASAKLQICENGINRIILGETKHQCNEFFKYEDFCGKEVTINSSNFLAVSQNGKIIKYIVFTTSAQDECYEFGLLKASNVFQCNGCNRKRKYITVKLIKDKNQEFLKMSNPEHVCQPRKYIKEKHEPKIIPPELFECYSNENETNKYLIIFTSEKKEFVYQYSMLKSGVYRCAACCRKNLWVNAKVIERSGQKHVECGQNEHICEPKKYVPEKFGPPKMVSNNLFAFHDGKNGEKDYYLIIFTSTKKDIAYRYSLQTDGSYRCMGCVNKNSHISAKIVKNENGSITVKLGEKGHICKPQKYDPKNF